MKQRPSGRIVFALLCCLLILGTVSMASAAQKSGIYIGGALGSAFTDVSEGFAHYSDNDLGYKVFAGYNFGALALIDLAVEGTYVDFGEASSKGILNQSVDITAWDAFGVCAINIGPFAYFVKMGQVWWDSDWNSLQNVFDDSGNDMAYGTGFRFQVENFAVRTEYEYFDIDMANVSYASISMAWTF